LKNRYFVIGGDPLRTGKVNYMRSNTQSSASATQEFHRLMKKLLQFMSIQQSASMDDPAIYSFTFDGKTEVNIFHPEEHSVDILAKIGILQNKKAYTTLLNLLAMNCYHRDGAPMNIGLDPISGKATLWMRVPLASLDPDKLTALIGYILEKATEVQQQLKGSASHESAAGSNSVARNSAFRINSSQLIKQTS